MRIILEVRKSAESRNLYKKEVDSTRKNGKMMMDLKSFLLSAEPSEKKNLKASTMAPASGEPERLLEEATRVA
jgi:hypothetical protein